jgi:hypothetical protein
VRTGILKVNAVPLIIEHEIYLISCVEYMTKI